MKVLCVIKTAVTGVFVGSLMVVGSSQASAEVVVVVGAKNPAPSLTREQVSEIFMGKVTAMPGGGNVELLDQADSNPIREEFYSKVIGKSAAQAKAYWAKLAFTGRGTPPRENANSAEIKKALAANPRALGYIEKSTVDDSVRVLFAAP